MARADGGRLLIEKMRLDDAGFPQPTGEFTELAADCLVLALGQEADLSALDGVPGVEFSGGVVQVGPDLMTGHPGIFAGGDMVPGERTVTVAVGHGKKAARCIDAWLRGNGNAQAPRHELAPFGNLNTWYYADAPATVRPHLDAARRTSTFDEVVGGLPGVPRVVTSGNFVRVRQRRAVRLDRPQPAGRQQKRSLRSVAQAPLTARGLTSAVVSPPGGSSGR